MLGQNSDSLSNRLGADRPKQTEIDRFQFGRSVFWSDVHLAQAETVDSRSQVIEKGAGSEQNVRWASIEQLLQSWRRL